MVSFQGDSQSNYKAVYKTFCSCIDLNLPEATPARSELAARIKAAFAQFFLEHDGPEKLRLPCWDPESRQMAAATKWLRKNEEHEILCRVIGHACVKASPQIVVDEMYRTLFTKSLAMPSPPFHTLTVCDRDYADAVKVHLFFSYPQIKIT